MLVHEITDWDDAYANSDNIPGGADYPQKWVALAEKFRTGMAAAARAELDLAYGPEERNRFDVFHASGIPKGLVVFVHGGYWMRFDKFYWSHLAAGPLAYGFSVAMPSYTLCPDIRIAGITQEIGQAIAKAAEIVTGPILLAGHSAGGHLVSRMVCADAPLSKILRERVRHTLSISGVHDLRPLMRLSSNAVLKIDEAEARAESPALLDPVEGARITCWVGAGERSEFLRQNALLANIWKGLGALTACVEEPDRHHFNVIDGLTDPDHAMTRLLCQAA
jgi:acetyl esterase/lipase